MIFDQTEKSVKLDNAKFYKGLLLKQKTISFPQHYKKKIGQLRQREDENVLIYLHIFNCTFYVNLNSIIYQKVKEA